jgi:ubiquitin-conjugating enzyme E2 J2
MAPQMATGRLRKELMGLKKDPPPGIIAEPKENDILTWHYAIRGPSDTPYEGGVYVGKLKFPNEYPMSGPAIYMLTPSGRFQPNTKLCMSMSDFHPESWNPMWSVATIIHGIQSFMASEELTTGGMKAPDAERKKLAAVSMEYNRKMFANLFGGNIEQAFDVADEARIKAEKLKASKSSSSAKTSTRRTKQSAAKNSGESKVDQDTEEKTSQVDAAPAKELTPEEIEKRRIKNAKKRAKQKAKKAAAAAAGESS